MTEHPLTDKFLTQFGTPDDRCVEGERVFFDDDMRAAADWQLAQCLDYIRTTYGDNAMVPFMEAMRPTQQDNS